MVGNSQSPEHFKTTAEIHR